MKKDNLCLLSPFAGTVSRHFTEYEERMKQYWKAVTLSSPSRDFLTHTRSRKGHLDGSSLKMAHLKRYVESSAQKNHPKPNTNSINNTNTHTHNTCIVYVCNMNEWFFKYHHHHFSLVVPYKSICLSTIHCIYTT